MPTTASQWITLIALAVGVAAAILDIRPVAAFAFFVTIIFGLASARVERNADRYRL